MSLILRNSQQCRYRILFIGGNGNLGSVVSNALSQKYFVVSPNSKELDWTNLTVVTDFLSDNQFDILINFSYYNNQLSSPLEVYRINKAIVDNIRINSQCFKQVIHIGSIVEEEGAMKFDLLSCGLINQIGNKDLYSINKYYALSVLKHTRNYVILRVPPCFGNHGHIDKYINNLIQNVLIGDEKMIFTSREDKLMPYLYVYDLVLIIDYIIERNYSANTHAAAIHA